MASEDVEDEALWSGARERGPEREQLAQLALLAARSELARRGAPSEELEDLAQEAVRSTLAYIARGAPPPRDLSAFLKYRAWGVLSDFRKRQRARPVPDSAALLDPPSDPSRGPRESLARRQLLAALAECRTRLNDEQRSTLELRYEAGLEGEAIAARLGVHRNTVHVRVHRALIALRECLQRKGLVEEDLSE